MRLEDEREQRRGEVRPERKRAREKLAGPTTMREKAWTHLFITGKTPDEAAHEANIYYSNSQVRPKR